MFPSLRASSKKRDSDVISASSAASRGSESKGRASSFSLSRLLPSRRRSKSRLSLDSEPSRSEPSGACGNLNPVPYPSSGVGGGGAAQAAPRSSPPPNLSNVHQLGLNSPSISTHSASKEQGECHPHLHWAQPLGRIASEDNFAETSLVVTGVAMAAGGVGQKGGGREVMLECPVCLMEKPRDNFLEISTCHHRCCSKCLKEYFKIEIMESRVNIACPECSELFHPNDIQTIVQDEVLMQKYEDFMLRRVLAMDSDTRWCPAPDCGFAVVATGCAGCPKLKCERDGCGTFFCYHCKQYWHPNQTCDAARAERSPNMRSASVSYSQESGNQNEIKSCPRCGAFIVKMDDGSCNHMTCPVCEAAFCWLCMKEISDLHYLSPSGCTFWGRKPWSRKKKILWQLGTLVGAPVGITLLAGIAVPAMIVGIPVWVGRKIHYRYDKSSKHKRRLAITGGVFASVLASPVLAGLAVGIGVPILLVYVYGVVPFSLCRSGGCGVTTTNTGGVRFEFDEDNETNTQGPYSYTGDNHSIETAPNVANPSIAPSIGDASLGMTNSLSASGSHMERAGVLRDDSDRDSSSHRAIAGNSINGSLCSATYSAQHHKLEVQADISEQTGQCERSSVGGESYNVSLNDDASTRALAGSIVSPKDKDGISLCSRHFDGAPIIYPEEGQEEECATYSITRQQQRGSSSCPTSPHLRKASPAPSEDTRSTRGKKCTRFMDQVSEIESTKEGDCLSMGSVLSSGSNSPCVDVINETPRGLDTGMSLEVVAATITESSLSLTSTAIVSTCALTSCESLLNEARTTGAGICKSVSLGNSCRVKAESTSVLLDGVESRRCEMGGVTRRKSESAFKTEHCTVDRGSLISSRKKGNKPGEKEHRSQPGNLSDISEIRGMPPLHATACSDLLAVIDTSCENVFLDKTGQTKLRLTSTSSFSSTDESSLDLHSHRSSLRRTSSPSGHLHHHLPLNKSQSLSEDMSEDNDLPLLQPGERNLSSPGASVSDMQVDIVENSQHYQYPVNVVKSSLESSDEHFSTFTRIGSGRFGLDSESKKIDTGYTSSFISNTYSRKFETGPNILTLSSLDAEEKICPLVLQKTGDSIEGHIGNSTEDMTRWTNEEPVSSQRRDLSVSRTNIGWEPDSQATPLPVVEGPQALSAGLVDISPRSRTGSDTSGKFLTTSLVKVSEPVAMVTQSKPRPVATESCMHSKSPCLILTSSSVNRNRTAANMQADISKREPYQSTDDV